jgi:hypothetical protein
MTSSGRCPRQGSVMVDIAAGWRTVGGGDEEGKERVRLGRRWSVCCVCVCVLPCRLTYWVIFGFLTVMETFSTPILAWFPPYCACYLSVAASSCTGPDPRLARILTHKTHGSLPRVDVLVIAAFVGTVIIVLC